MAVMFITFVILLLVIAGMSVGVIFANKPIKGSCGGLGNLGLKDSCPICGDEEHKPLPKAAEDLFYDATSPQGKV